MMHRLLALLLLSCAPGLSGCELIADFDRSTIPDDGQPDGGSAQEDAGNAGSSDSAMDGSMDEPDAMLPEDSGADGATAEDSGTDSGMPDSAAGGDDAGGDDAGGDDAG